MEKTQLNRPVLIALYGLPGAGKSYVAKNLADELKIAHISADKIRGELFESPRYSQQENSIVAHLMEYMAGEFLKAGHSVVFDINAMRFAQRRKLRELAHKHKAKNLLIWIQIDQDSAFARTQTRDKRTSDSKYAQTHDHNSFKNYVAHMQNPTDEEFLVISGKHSFASQKPAIVNRLFQLGLIKSSDVQHNIPRPDLVNLIPNYRPYDSDGRNISVY